MIKTTYSAQDVYLLDVAPDWQKAVALTCELLRDEQTGLSNREGRRGYSAALLCSLKFTLLAEGQDARRVAGGLRELTDEPVLVPLWPFAARWADRASRPVSGGLNLVFKADFSQYEIYESVEPGWPADDDQVAPLLWGRLDSRKPSWLDSDKLELTVEFVEQSKAAWAIVPAAVVFAAGPTPSGAYATVPRIFPFEINFDAGRPDEFTVAILREKIGFGREPAQTFYPQGTARNQESSHALTSLPASAEMLEFFRQHGTGKVFWTPNWVNAAVLTADAGASATTLNVVDTAAVQIGDWLALIAPDSSITTTQVTNKTSTTITVFPGLDAAATAGVTVVAALLLAKLDESRIALTFYEPVYAEATLSMRELPAEYDPAADETQGTTIGLLAPRCYLYEFSRELDGTTFTDRWTSYESDLTYSGNTYTAVKTSHGDLSQGLYLDRDELEIKTDVFSGNPLLKVACLKMEAPLIVTVMVGDVNAGAATNVSVIYTGEVGKVSVQGSRLTASVAAGSTIFDRPVPRMLFQRSCNYGLFTPGCTLAKADWTWTAQISSVGSPGYPFEFVLKSLARVSGADPPSGGYSDNWFALGWLELNLATGDFQRRPILLSTNPAGGVLTVTLDRDPDPFPAVNDNVRLFPGCPLDYGTCGSKFNNAVNFGGHPFMPLGNPSLVKPVQGPGTGGKK